MPVILAEQASQMDDGFSDINSNFIISSFGIFEGRGWDWQAENISLLPADLMLFSFVGETPETGTEEYEKFQKELFAKLHKFIEDGVVIGKIDSGFEFQCLNTLCPTNGAGEAS